MTSVDSITALRQIRGYYIDIFTSLSKQLDEYEASSHQGGSDLLVIKKWLRKVWKQFKATKHNILELDEEEHTHDLDITDQYNDLVTRLSCHLSSVQQASSSIPPECESGTGSGPTLTPPPSPQRGRKFTPSPRCNTQEQRKQCRRKSTTSKKIDPPVTSPSVPVCHNLLITAQINIYTDKEHPIQCRALLDTGSTVNFITEKLAKSLGLKQRRCSIPIEVLDTINTTAKRYITTTISSMEGTYKRTMTFLVIPKIATLVPDQPIDRSLIQMPRNLQLADPRFHIPGPIDVLLSVEVTLGSLCSGQIVNQSNDTDYCLQKTQFGWVIGGRLFDPLTSSS